MPMDGAVPASRQGNKMTTTLLQDVKQLQARIGEKAENFAGGLAKLHGVSREEVVALMRDHSLSIGERARYTKTSVEFNNAEA